MGNSSSTAKFTEVETFTDAETTALEHFNNKDFASLITLLEQEPVDLFKLVSFNRDNPEDIKNGRDFIHTLLASDHQSFGSSSSSAVSILKAFKQTIESNKQKNRTANGPSDKKLSREIPQFDKFPYSYLQFVIFNHPEDLDSFIFLLDNKETFPSPPPASQSLVHDLCSNPRAIELLRHLISSGEFPERFKNSSSTDNLDEQMRGSANSVVIEEHRGFTPLQAACAAVNKLAVQELCVAGLGGSNYDECAETLFTSAIAGEQHHNLGLFKGENGEKTSAEREFVSADDVSDILLCLLAQPNAGSSIRKHRVQLYSIQSQKARDNIVAVFESQFNISSLNTLNLMHLAFAFYDGLNKNNTNNNDGKNSNNNNNNNDSSADTFLKTVLENKLAVCRLEELTWSIEKLFKACTKSCELKSGLTLIGKWLLSEWLITIDEQELDLCSSFQKLVDDETLRCLSLAIPFLQSLNLTKCDITDTGLEHLTKLSALQSLDLRSCSNISDSGLQHVAKLTFLESLNLASCGKITDDGVVHLGNLSSLKSLNLESCKLITDDGLHHLAKVSSLKTLNLKNCDKIKCRVWECLETSEQKLDLSQELDLFPCRELVDDANLRCVLSVFRSFQGLKLSWCKLITDNGLQHLAVLCSLQTLDLRRCDKITDSGLQHLTKLSSLQTLSLDGCDKITDDGLQHLATLSSLQTLNLESCIQFTDTGLQHLAKLSSLLSLNLNYCYNITDSGLKDLVKLSSLQSLNLRNCDKITGSGLEHLRTKLPTVHIS